MGGVHTRVGHFVALMRRRNSVSSDLGMLTWKVRIASGSSFTGELFPAVAGSVAVAMASDAIPIGIGIRAIKFRDRVVLEIRSG